MTEKRFENRLSKNNLKFLYQNPVWDNEKKDALNVFEMIDLLNELNEENNELRLQLNLCSDQRNEFHRGARENANRVGKLEKENEQLKQHIQTLQKQTKRLENDNIQTYTLIKEALANERTSIGQSVLKQLMERIQ